MQESTRSHVAILQKQHITGDSPGPILVDFETLLDFVGVGGLESGGKNCRLPLTTLGALDERMAHPLRPKLERPQQLSYPHLNGLLLFYSATRAWEFLAVIAIGRDSPSSLSVWKNGEL